MQQVKRLQVGSETTSYPSRVPPQATYYLPPPVYVPTPTASSTTEVKHVVSTTGAVVGSFMGAALGFAMFFLIMACFSWRRRLYQRQLLLLELEQQRDRGYANEDDESMYRQLTGEDWSRGHAPRDVRREHVEGSTAGPSSRLPRHGIGVGGGIRM